MSRHKKATATVSGLDDKIDDWFWRHFNHVTPGTPDHAVLTAAREDLKRSLAPEPAAADPA